MSAGFSFAPLRKRRMGEPVVPMINVVFLLLIFFLMSAQITSAPPFDVVTPQAAASDGRTPPERTLWIDASGRLAYDTARGDAVWPLVAAGSGPLHIRADAQVPAARLAALLPRLAALGVTETVLITAKAPRP